MSFSTQKNASPRVRRRWTPTTTTTRPPAPLLWPAAMLERVRIGGFSGTYKVRSAELARDKKAASSPAASTTKAVTVLFLDDTTHTFQLEKKAKGHELLEQVFRHLELSERDYFGLQFQPKCSSSSKGKPVVVDVVGDNGSSGSSGSGGANANAGLLVGPGRWLDPNKPFRKQWNSVRLSGEACATLSFRVKFYVTDPSRLHEEYTRYQFYLQIKRDIFRGKLPVGLNTACLLASYTVQCEYYILLLFFNNLSTNFVKISPKFQM